MTPARVPPPAQHPPAHTLRPAHLLNPRSPQAISSAVTAAYNDGSLAAKLRALGLDLTGAPQLPVSPDANTPTTDTSGGGLSGGAIAGITIGAVAAAAAGVGGVAYASRKRKAGAPAEAPKAATGDMFSTNPAFAAEEQGGALPEPKAKSARAGVSLGRSPELR